MAAHSLRTEYDSAPELEDHHLGHFAVDRKHKLIFCWIEKDGTLSFTTMMDTLVNGFGPHPSPYWEARNLAHLSKDELESTLADQTWHKAVFYRDPLHRFVSAFRSKCEVHDEDGKEQCLDEFNKFPITFAEAVRIKTNAPGNNRHWEKQSRFCGGLHQTVGFYNTVALLDRATVRAEVEKMLKTVGVDETTIAGLLSQLPEHAKVSDNSHDTNTEHHISEYFKQVTESEYQALVDVYQEDYDTFGITPPSYASLTSDTPS